MTKKKRKNTEFKTQETKKTRYQNLKQFQNKTVEEIELETKKVEKTKKRLQDLDIIEFATDPDYLGLSFKKRPAQEVLLRSLYGMTLNKEQLKIYQKLTKNKKEFEAGIEKEEAIFILGARSGKSFLASVIALYEGTRKKWQKYLNKGESAFVVIVSTRQRQSEQIIGANCLYLMENSKNLKGLIKDSTMSELTLKNNIKIVSSPCTSLAYRGNPIICLICDEIGHFFTQGPKADIEILGALLPRMSQFYGAKLILISTPSAKQGSLWNYYEKGFKEHKRLTAQSDSLFMNPLINKDFLERERARDVDNFQREFLAEFCEKAEAFLSLELVENALKLAGDLPYKEGNRYYMGIDASGLSLRDKFALAIAHKEGLNVYIDRVKSWDLKDPDPIMKDIKELADIYHINRVSIDRYARGWVEASLKKIKLFVDIRPSLASIYINLKSLMLGNKLHLPDSPGIKKAFLNTQSFYGRNNALSIAHERNSEGHADEADSIATVCFDVIEKKEEEPPQIIRREGNYIWVERDPKSPPPKWNQPHLVKPGDPDY